eukprot:EG_transcript_60736
MALSAVPYSHPQFPYSSLGAGFPLVNPSTTVTTSKKYNPFKTYGSSYFGEIGVPNPQRPALRPANDKLDRFVALCVEKLDAGLDQIKGLAEEVERMQQDIAASHAGGDPE